MTTARTAPAVAAPRRAGRPRTAPADRLAAHVGLWLPQDRADELARQARALGLRPAVYARTLVLGALAASA
jgi:hypothetical protein